MKQISDRTYELLKKDIDKIEGKKDKPEMDEEYRSIYSCRTMYRDVWIDSQIDNRRLVMGNYFWGENAKQEAEAHKMRLMSMAERGEMPEEEKLFWSWDFLDECGFGSPFVTGSFDLANYWIGNCHKTEEEAEAWYKKYGKYFERK